ncbi:EAL domain-containing protein [Aquabacterium soli]|uniref:EAL domain-containing protein n=1 Tax=Aquabacterium soli TaxID=2493092 RepID=A0A426VDH1_9BURK|nr:EAL domain-containing protein [Aquabacterium soli]RRS04928.1 EAL domain-containing protein [Aquabacterium soli]
MQSEINKAKTESAWLKRGAWVVLVLGLCASMLMWQRTAVQLRAQAELAFRHDTQDQVAALQRQIDRYIDLLSSFQAMYLVNGDVSRAAFHNRYVTLRKSADYQALMAIQFAELVPQARKAEFEAAVRADHSVHPAGYPDYAIHPAGTRPNYVAVKYTEPLVGNEKAMGFDIAGDAQRRASLEAARDSGKVVVSTPVPLVQLDTDRTGFVIRLPVYASMGNLDSRAARRQAYLGQITGVFRASDLMRQVLPADRWRQLQWRVTDLGDADQPAGSAIALFDSAAHGQAYFNAQASALAADTRDYQVDVAGRRWQVSFAQPTVNQALQPYPLALLMAGVLASVGLWWAIRGAASRHHLAAQMAMEISRKARDSEQQLRSVVDHTVDGIIVIGEDGHIISVNQALCRIFGHGEIAMVGQHLSLLVPAAVEDAGQGHSVDTFLKTQHVGLIGLGRRAEGRRANGQRFPVDLAISTMEQDGVTQYIGIVRDLSDQAAAEMAVLEAQRQLNEVDEMRRVIVHHAPYAILMLNRHGIIQTVNPAGEALLGYRLNELMGQNTTQRFFDPNEVSERAHMLALRLNQPVTELNVLTHLAEESPGLPSEWTLIRADGRPLVAEISVTELCDEMGNLTGYLAMAQDVTLRREAENQLQHMAMHDALTALPNRNMLQDQLKASMVAADRGGHAMALMFLDLDRFKKINDSLGHHIGDSVLIEVARRLRSAMRTSDIVARLGGDEFVILLPQIAEEGDGERVAQKVLDLFTEPLRVGPHELRVTPSVGLVIYPQHGSDAITLMRHADLAMYRAKNNGRNRIQVYGDQMESPTADTLVLENDLYKALERNELRLHYQPQFDCATGQITGAEALLRWEHKGKLVSPAEFIPLAEESGLIVEMGAWVLREACAKAQAWRSRTGWPLRIAVNLSAVQLDQADITATVAQALHETGLPATALELEITESVVVRESLRAADILTELRALGVGIAIDDFGVGYSSFAYLRELPVDRFKLDRSFLSAVPQSEGDSRLAAALIAMAHRLEVGIVAEGVETEEQNAFLRDHGCDEAQGYHLGRPMKDDAFEALLVQHAQERSTFKADNLHAPA